MTDPILTCPSSQPDAANSRIIGVVGGTVAQPRVDYLARDVTVPEALRELPEGVSPTRVFRFAGDCIGGACKQFAGGGCQLGKNIARMLDPVADALPACTIRATCRWFAENGRESCVRCPQVMTTVRSSDDVARAAVQ